MKKLKHEYEDQGNIY